MLYKNELQLPTTMHFRELNTIREGDHHLQKSISILQLGQTTYKIASKRWVSEDQIISYCGRSYSGHHPQLRQLDAL